MSTYAAQGVDDVVVLTFVNKHYNPVDIFWLPEHEVRVLDLGGYAEARGQDEESLWLAGEGESVARDDVLFRAYPVPSKPIGVKAPVAGKLTKQLVGRLDTVAVGTVIGLIQTEDERLHSILDPRDSYEQGSPKDALWHVRDRSTGALLTAVKADAAKEVVIQADRRHLHLEDISPLADVDGSRKLEREHRQYALDFDGVNDVVVVKDSRSLQFSRKWTLEAWIYRNAEDVEHPVLEKAAGAKDAVGYSLRVGENNRLQAGLMLGNTFLYGQGDVEIKARRWYHVAASFDATQYDTNANKPAIQCYVDGKPVTTTLSQSLDFSSQTPAVHFYGNGAHFEVSGAKNFTLPDPKNFTVEVWTRIFLDKDAPKDAVPLLVYDKKGAPGWELGHTDTAIYFTYKNGRTTQSVAVDNKSYEFAYELQTSKLGSGIAGGTVQKWYKAEGDRVALGEKLVQVHTDENETVDLQAPVAGILKSPVAQSSEFTADKTLARIAIESEIKIPRAGSKRTGTVMWDKNVRDAVRFGEGVAEFHTTEGVLDVPAPSSGILRQKLKKDGDKVSRGEAVGLLQAEADPGGWGYWEAGKWCHVAVVVTAGKPEIYIDGEHAPSSSISIPARPAGNHFRVGGGAGAARDDFQGEMCELRIWKDARAESDVRTYYKRQLPDHWAGLIAYYPMDDDAVGKPLKDHAGTSHLAAPGPQSIEACDVSDGPIIADISTRHDLTALTVELWFNCPKLGSEDQSILATANVWSSSLRTKRDGSDLQAGDVLLQGYNQGAEDGSQNSSFYYDRRPWKYDPSVSAFHLRVTKKGKLRVDINGWDERSRLQESTLTTKKSVQIDTWYKATVTFARSEGSATSEVTLDVSYLEPRTASTLDVANLDRRTASTKAVTLTLTNLYFAPVLPQRTTFKGGGFKGKLAEVRLWDRALSDVEIETQTRTQGYTRAQGLLGYWKLDRDFRDSGPWSFPTLCPKGVAPGSTNVDPKLSATSFTIEFWARRSASDKAWEILHQGDVKRRRKDKYLHIGFRPKSAGKHPKANTPWGSYYENGFYFAFYSDDVGAFPNMDTRWHHWACVCEQRGDDYHRSIYLDGLPVCWVWLNKETIVGGDYFAVNEIGPEQLGKGEGRYDGPKMPISFSDSGGDLDRLRVWEVALTAEQIQEFMFLEKVDEDRLRSHALVGKCVYQSPPHDPTGFSTSSLQLYPCDSPRPVSNTGLDLMPATLSGALKRVSTAPLKIGACEPDNSLLFYGFERHFHFDGRIDSVRVWNTARTATQILGAWNQELRGTEGGLRGYWRFDEGRRLDPTDRTKPDVYDASRTGKADNQNHGYFGGLNAIKRVRVWRKALGESDLKGTKWRSLSSRTDGLVVNWDLDPDAELPNFAETAELELGTTFTIEAQVDVASLNLSPSRNPQLGVKELYLVYKDRSWVLKAFARGGKIYLGFAFNAEEQAPGTAWTEIESQALTPLAAHETRKWVHVAVVGEKADFEAKVGRLQLYVNEWRGKSQGTSRRFDFRFRNNLSPIRVAEEGRPNWAKSSLLLFGGVAFSTRATEPRVELAMGTRMDFSRGLTIEAWVNVDISKDSVGTRRPVVHLDDELSFEYELKDKRKGTLDLTFVGIPVTGRTFAAGVWTHVALTVARDGRVSVYIDGNLADNAPHDLAEPARYLTEHVFDSATIGSFYGRVDQVRIWKTARTQKQLRGYMRRLIAPEHSKLVGLWAFDEGAGTIAFDSGPQGHHGMLFEGAKWRTAAARGQRMDAGLSFDGQGQRVDFDFPNALPLKGSWTFELWLSLDTPARGKWAPIASFGGNFDVCLCVGSDGALYCSSGTGSQEVAGVFANVVTSSAWTHVAVVRDGGRFRVYRNGVARAWKAWKRPKSMTAAEGLAEVYLGQQLVTPKCRMDEVRFWSTDRSQRDIRANLYSRINPAASYLEAYWPLDDNTGICARDHTAHKRDGRLFNASGALPAWIHTPIPLSGYHLDGAAEYVEVAGAASGDDLNTRTVTDFWITAWIRPDRFEGLQGIVTKATDLATCQWGLSLEKDRLRFDYSKEGSSFSLVGGQLEPDWNHVAVVVKKQMAHVLEVQLDSGSPKLLPEKTGRVTAASVADDASLLKKALSDSKTLEAAAEQRYERLVGKSQQVTHPSTTPVVRDFPKVSLFVNGLLVHSSVAPVETAADTAPVVIGAWNDRLALDAADTYLPIKRHFFYGMIEEVRVMAWEQHMTQADVQTAMQTRTDPKGPGVIAAWNLGTLPPDPADAKSKVADEHGDDAYDGLYHRHEPRQQIATKCLSLNPPAFTHPSGFLNLGTLKFPASLKVDLGSFTFEALVKLDATDPVETNPVFSVGDWGFLIQPDASGKYLALSLAGPGVSNDAHNASATFAGVPKDQMLSRWLHVAWTYDGQSTVMLVGSDEYEGTWKGSKAKYHQPKPPGDPKEMPVVHRVQDLVLYRCTEKKKRKPRPSLSDPIQVGMRSGRGMRGNVAEVRLWNKVLTAEEFAQNRSKPLTGQESGLIGYWPLSRQPSGTTVKDRALYRDPATKELKPFGNDGTVDGWWSWVPFDGSLEELSVPTETQQKQVLDERRAVKSLHPASSPHTRKLLGPLENLPDVETELVLPGPPTPAPRVYQNPLHAQGRSSGMRAPRAVPEPLPDVPTFYPQTPVPPQQVGKNAYQTSAKALGAIADKAGAIYKLAGAVFKNRGLSSKASTIAGDFHAAPLILDFLGENSLQLPKLECRLLFDVDVSGSVPPPDGVRFEGKRSDGTRVIQEYVRSAKDKLWNYKVLVFVCDELNRAGRLLNARDIPLVKEIPVLQGLALTNDKLTATEDTLLKKLAATVADATDGKGDDGSVHWVSDRLRKGKAGQLTFSKEEWYELELELESRDLARRYLVSKTKLGWAVVSNDVPILPPSNDPGWKEPAEETYAFPGLNFFGTVKGLDKTKGPLKHLHDTFGVTKVFCVVSMGVPGKAGSQPYFVKFEAAVDPSKNDALGFANKLVGGALTSFHLTATTSRWSASNGKPTAQNLSLNWEAAAAAQLSKSKNPLLSFAHTAFGLDKVTLTVAASRRKMGSAPAKEEFRTLLTASQDLTSSSFAPIAWLKSFFGVTTWKMDFAIEVAKETASSATVQVKASTRIQLDPTRGNDAVKFIQSVFGVKELTVQLVASNDAFQIDIGLGVEKDWGAVSLLKTALRMELEYKPFRTFIGLAADASIEAGDDVIRLTGTFGFEVATGGVEAEGMLAMIGRWENPFDFEGVVLSDVVAEVGVTPRAPWVSSLGLAAKLEIGRAYMHAAIFVDTVTPSQCGFVADGKELNLIEIVDTLTGPDNTVPKALADTVGGVTLRDLKISAIPPGGFKVGVFAYNDEGITVLANLDLWGWTALGYLRVDYSDGLVALGSIDEINVANVLKIGKPAGSTLDVKAPPAAVKVPLGTGPILYVKLVPYEAPQLYLAASISLFGFSQSLIVSVSDAGITFALEGTIFDLFRASLTIRASLPSMGANNGMTSLYIKAELHNDFFAELRKKVRDAIEGLASGAIAAIDEAQAEVEKLYDVVEKMRRQVRAERMAAIRTLRAAERRVDAAQRKIDGILNEIESTKRYWESLPSADWPWKPSKARDWVWIGPKLAGLYIAYGVATAALELVKLALRGLQGLVAVIPIDADPRVAVPLALYYTAIGALEVTKTTIGGLANVVTFMTDMALGEFFDVRYAMFESEFGVATDGQSESNVDLYVNVRARIVFLGQELDLGFGINLKDLTDGVDALANRLVQKYLP